MVNVNPVKQKYQEDGPKKINSGDKKMVQKKISRRGFLKVFAGAAASTLLLPVSRLLNRQKYTPNKTNPAREAKYYKTADKLAG